MEIVNWNSEKDFEKIFALNVSAAGRLFVIVITYERHLMY